MAKGPQYVKDFDFSVKPCEYSYGGKVKGYAKGGVVEKATGERYPSKKVMMKHEAMETPRMQREEVMQRAEVKGAIPSKAMRRSVPVAPKVPMIGMQKGGSMKMGKVMGEFKAGDLHSGSKSGPVVTNRKQAVAIGMSEARKASKK